jgi:regulator of extracellular matrix RemA (YlzA/DUF370 family)
MKFSRLIVIFLVFNGSIGWADSQQVVNTESPVDGVWDHPLVEQWRAGGEDDEEVFFGNILQVLPDPDGGLYVLDSQLLQVFAFTADGEFRTILGGRGEGPGEITNVNSIINLPDGNLGLGQVLPGVVACVKPDGTPVTKIQIKDETGSDNSFVLYMDGCALGENILTLVMRWRMGDDGTMTQDMHLRSCNSRGEPLVGFLSKATTFDLTNFRFTEAGYDFVWTRFGVLPDGNVCFVPERNKYEIRICDPGGNILKSITRPYESWQRNSREKEESRLSHAAIASHYGREVRGVEVEDTEADITSLTVMSDGVLRVRTSRGDRERSDGVLTTVDEFDQDGRFVRQQRLLAPGNPDHDAIHMLPDGRVVVVKGAVEAYRREQNTARAEDVLETETTLELICYAPMSD